MKKLRCGGLSVDEHVLILDSQDNLSLNAGANVATSTANDVAGCVSSINAILLSLKNSGIMVGDTWNLSVTQVEGLLNEDDPYAQDISYNQSLASTTYSNGVITVTGDPSLFRAIPSSAGMGIKKWYAICLNCGGTILTSVRYNGTLLTQADIDDAESMNMDTTGDLIIWVGIDDINLKDKTFSLWSAGYGFRDITIRFVEG